MGVVKIKNYEDKCVYKFIVKVVLGFHEIRSFSSFALLVTSGRVPYKIACFLISSNKSALST